MHTKRITRHLSYANVMATIGVFIALGGASYAAVAIPANSVGTNQLKKSAVAGSKIKKNAISSAKVKDGSLQRGDFASGTLLQGLQGPKGDPGAQGSKGDAGAPGISGREWVVGAEVSVNPGQVGTAQVTCPAGKKVMGGSGGSEADNAPIVSMGQINDSTWGVRIRNNEAFPLKVGAQAVCAQVG
jgi:hypothetical protein